MKNHDVLESVYYKCSDYRDSSGSPTMGDLDQAWEIAFHARCNGESGDQFKLENWNCRLKMWAEISCRGLSLEKKSKPRF